MRLSPLSILLLLLVFCRSTCFQGFRYSAMTSEQSCESSPRLCANGCGFFGRPETQNLCSKCYRDSCIKQVQLHASSTTEPNAEEISVSSPIDSKVHSSNLEAQSSVDEKSKDRCGCCNKKLGLAKGFKCRCGNMYCSKHRYPEEHDCNFDFKAVARDLLAKNNPLVQADKLERL